MRRADKQVTDPAQLGRIIDQSLYGHLALCDNGEPYVIPVSFGRENRTLYLHTACEGLKVTLLEKHPRACVAFETEVSRVEHPDIACRWSLSFHSVVGRGPVEEVTDPEGKEHGLRVLMRHYAGTGRDWTFSPQQTAQVRVWKITLETLSGKRSKDKSDL